MDKRHLPAAAALAAALWLPGNAWAAMAESDPFDGLAALDHAELGESRGGMMIGGIPVDFAVVIRTTVEGAVAQGLQTVLAVNDQGKLGGATTTAIGDTSSTNNGGSGGSGGSVSRTGSGGMAMSLGNTTILHQVIQDQVQTLIANTRNDVTINHHTELNVELPGFTQMTQTFRSHNYAAMLGRDAALNGLGR